MPSSIETRRPVNRKARQPLRVELTLTINGTPYVVIPIEPGPDNTKAFRLVKHGNAEAVYDVCRTAEGLVECDCPSYEATYRGNGLATCKHGQALIQVGLLEPPSVTPIGVTAPASHVRDEFDEPARAAHDDAREAAAAIAEREAVAPVPAVPAFDVELYRCQSAVAEGRALWLTHRDMFASEPLPAPEAAPVVCCSADESMPCTACVNADEPADPGDGWDDGARWELGPDAPADRHDDERWTITDPDDGPPARLTFADWIADQAAGHARIGGARHVWLASQIAELAELARHLEATSPEAFADRLDAMRDAEAARAEARHGANC